jgi:hypothetical protein
MWSSLLSVVLVINELMASNAGVVMSPATNFDSWIEIYNPEGQAVNLSGMYLSNDADNLKRWQMPGHIGTVPAKGFLVVWLGSEDIKDNQAPFKLDCDGGSIFLSDKNGNLITSMDYPEAKSRTAYARTTDGGDKWGWTAYPTPGATNATSVFASERLAAPVVDAGSQILKGTLSVKVEIPEGTTLIYTTDGSVPVNTSSGQRSTTGEFSVSETTNYVFRLFKDGYLPSVPVTRSYIKTSHSYSIPIVSIVGDERYFTDNVWGIDVRGTNGKTGKGSEEPVNWNMEWDRPVNFSYINASKGMLFNQDVNISVSGGWTRAIDPRSMKLKSNKIFDGQNRFDYAFFSQKPYIRSKALLIRNGGNDVWNNHARFTDVALTNLIQRSGLDVDVQSYVQVAEYINGRFKGILNLREPSNDKFVYANYGYDDEEIDMFENDTFNNGDDQAYERLCKLAENSSNATNYEAIKRLLDVDEFINYMAVEIYLGNDDWPENNVKAYRSRNDGRFRFICFDLDYTFNPWDRNSFNAVLDDHNDVKMVVLFQNLLKNETFRRQFIDTYCIVAGSVFEKKRATDIINNLVMSMGPMSQLDGYTPDNAANKIKEKLQSRLSEMMSRMQQYSLMKLSGVRPQSVTISSDHTSASLFINGLKVPYAAFDGKLFPPVTLEAKAPAGQTFTGWKKSKSTTVQVLKSNAVWKYYDKGALSDNSWRSSTFNDASWASGQAPLGYKFPDVKTTVGYGPDAQNKYPTTYFRTTVDLNATPGDKDVFELNYQLDDGFVIYVNGQDAGRVNMRSGEVDFNSFATDYAVDVPISGTLSLSPKLFKKGKNTIAVEVHNNQAASSDLFWSCELFTSVGADHGETVIKDPVISLSAEENNITLEACFTPLSDAERTAQGFTPVCINEVSAANGIYVNEYFKRNDWIELYNTTDAVIDVAGMYLSDNLEKPKKYQIPTGLKGVSTRIPAHGYLIVWCDKLEPLTQLHASFKIDDDGGDVVLTAKDESWSNRLTYAKHKSDETVGRYPDGAANVLVMNIPTIAKSNINSSYTVEVPQSATGIQDLMADATDGLSIRYVAGRLVCCCATATKLDIRITNLAGQQIAMLPATLQDGYVEVSIDQLPAGVYIATITDTQGHKAACKLIKH